MALAAELLSQNPECTTDLDGLPPLPDDHVTNPDYFTSTSKYVIDFPLQLFIPFSEPQLSMCIV